LKGLYLSSEEYMKKIMTIGVLGLVLLGTTNISFGAKADEKQYEVISSTQEVTAKVKSIDQKNMHQALWQKEKCPGLTLHYRQK